MSCPIVRARPPRAGQIKVGSAEIDYWPLDKRSDRPRLAAAKKAKATLIIAKLDRLARNFHFISGLMESGVDFVAADNPHANKLMVKRRTCQRPATGYPLSRIAHFIFTSAAMAEQNLPIIYA